MKERILKTAAEMGYTPNYMASALKSSRTRMVGIIIPAIRNTFYVDLLRYIEGKLHAAGYRILVSFIQEEITEADALQTMMMARPEALIFFSGRQENQKLFAQIAKEADLIQLFNRSFAEYSYLAIDDYGGTKKTTEYLIGKGHRNILYTELLHDRRGAGFRDAMREAGIETDEEHIFRCEYQLFSSEDEKEKYADELAARIQKLKPTAVFGTSVTSECCYHAIMKLGLRIPEDISFIVYDDVSWVRMLGISSIGHPMEEIADIVTAHIVSRSEKKEKPPIAYETKPFLIERKSVRDITESSF